MTYRIQIYYREAGLFMNTNHESDNLEELKSLASNELFSGSRVRIVDDSQHVLFEPPVRERAEELSVPQLAAMLGVPVVDGVPVVEPPPELSESFRKRRTLKARCLLEVLHKLPPSHDEPLDFDSPEGLQRLKDEAAD